MELKGHRGNVFIGKEGGRWTFLLKVTVNVDRCVKDSEEAG